MEFCFDVRWQWNIVRTPCEIFSSQVEISISLDKFLPLRCNIQMKACDLLLKIFGKWNIHGYRTNRKSNNLRVIGFFFHIRDEEGNTLGTCLTWRIWRKKRLEKANTLVWMQTPLRTGFQGWENSTRNRFNNELFWILLKLIVYAQAIRGEFMH